jgi:hypothetical protein
VSWGAVVATVLWLLGSALFAIYASNLGSYDKTYGSLGGVVVLMLWLDITALVIIIGAELNAELEEWSWGSLFRTITAPHRAPSACDVRCTARGSRGGYRTFLARSVSVIEAQRAKNVSRAKAPHPSGWAGSMGKLLNSTL